MKDKNPVGRPKGNPTCKPNLRCDKSDWEMFKLKFPGKTNQMFNKWVKGFINEKAKHNL